MPYSKVRDGKFIYSPTAWLCSDGGHAYLILEYVGHQQSWLNVFCLNTHYIEIMDFTGQKVRPPMVINFEEMWHIDYFNKAKRNATFYPISSEQLNKIRNCVIQLVNSPPKFNFFGGNTDKVKGEHNCTSLLIAILKEAEVKVEESFLNSIFVHPNLNASANFLEWLKNFFRTGTTEYSSTNTTLSYKTPSLYYKG